MGPSKMDVCSESSLTMARRKPVVRAYSRDGPPNSSPRWPQVDPWRRLGRCREREYRERPSSRSCLLNEGRRVAPIASPMLKSARECVRTWNWCDTQTPCALPKVTPRVTSPEDAHGFSCRVQCCIQLHHICEGVRRCGVFLRGFSVSRISVVRDMLTAAQTVFAH